METLHRPEHQHILPERVQQIAAWIDGYVKPVLRAIAQEVQPSTAVPTTFEPRLYQMEALAALNQARENGRTAGLVHLATGLGKTTLGVLDFMRFRMERLEAGLPEPKALFVSPQHAINNQAEERSAMFLPELETSFFRAWRKRLPKAEITFATMQGLSNHLGRFGRRHFDYIIYDEAHHAYAETYEEIIQYFKPAWQLALTATPYRSDGKDIAGYFGKPIYKKSLPQALAEGLLADVDYHLMLDDTVRRALEGGFQAQALKELHAIFAENAPIEAIAKSLLEERRTLGLSQAKTIVFCASVEQTIAVANLMGGTAYHSRMPQQEQQQILQDFRTGVVKTLCTMNKCNEGVDIPDAEVVAFIRNIWSRVLFEQQLGRGLRRTKDKKKLIVFDYAANLERIAAIWKLARETAIYAKQASQQTSQHGDLFRRTMKHPSRHSSSDSPTEGATGNILFKSSHSNFTFSKTVVDLLEKAIDLNAPPAQKGDMSVESFRKQLGINYRTLIDLLDKADIPVIYRQFGTRTGRALTLDMQRAILSHPERQIPPATEGDMTVTAFAESIGVDPKTVHSLIKDKKHGLSAEPRRFPSGRKGMALDAVAQAKLKELLKERQETPILNEDEISVSAFAKMKSKKITTVRRYMRDNKISAVQRIHPKSGKFTLALTADARAQLDAIIDFEAAEHRTV